MSDCAKTLASERASEACTRGCEAIIPDTIVFTGSGSTNATSSSDYIHDSDQVYAATGDRLLTRGPRQAKCVNLQQEKHLMKCDHHTPINRCSPSKIPRVHASEQEQTLLTIADGYSSSNITTLTPDVQLVTASASSSLESQTTSNNEASIPVTDNGYSSRDGSLSLSDTQTEACLDTESGGGSGTCVWTASPKHPEPQLENAMSILSDEGGLGSTPSDVKDLLHHFDQFFRARFESELDLFRDSVDEMFSEQQIHVHRIIQASVASYMNTDISQTHEKDVTDMSKTEQICEEPADTVDWSRQRACCCRHNEDIAEDCSEVSQLRQLLRLITAAGALTVQLHRKEFRS